MGGHHLLMAGKKFQKCLVCFAPFSRRKVVFPFSVPIIFLEPALYGAHKHPRVVGNHHSVEDTHQPATEQKMLRSGPGTSERGSVVMAAAAADTRVDCHQQTVR